jgi:hypothetical protein
MSNIMIKPGTPPAMAKAIADGALKAENKALLETIDMLMCEIAHKDELLELYRWKEQREGERMLVRYYNRQPKPSLWQKLVRICREALA